MLTTAGNSRASDGTAFVHADFVLTGMVMTLLGPMLPMLLAKWNLSDTQAGYLFVAQFIASMLGMFASGVLVQRVGSRRTLVMGLILMAGGIALLAQANWAFGLVAVAIFGVGFGSNTPAANLFVADANPERRAASLNWLNASWGIGAMGCPLLVAWAQRFQRVPWFLYGLSAGLLVLAAVLSGVRFSGESGAAAPAQMPSPAGVWRDPRIPLVSALFFIYVGTETSAGGWVAPYAHRMDLNSNTLWAMTPSFFWGAVLIGRMAAPFVLRKWRETTVASWGLILASGGIALLVAAKGINLVVIGASVAGLGLAPVYPICVSMLSRWFGKSATRVSGAIFAGGNLGGAGLPWLVGALSTHYGNLRIGFFVPLAGALIMLAVYGSQR